MPDQPDDCTADARSTLPKVTDILPDVGDIESAPHDIVEQERDEDDFRGGFQNRAVRSEMEWAHLQAVRDHYEHKKKWSWFLIATIGGMVAFQWLLLFCVGLGWWDFTKYEWLLPILLVQNLGQIIGLAFVVVKSLFKDIKL